MTGEELKSYLTDLKNCAHENGMVFHQLHGTWPHIDDWTEEGREKTTEYFKKCIVGATYLDCSKVVVHPFMPNLYFGDTSYDSEKDFEINARMLKELAPIARENGVTICFENMPFTQWSPFAYVENIKRLIRQIDDPNVKVCLDVGHFNSEKGDIYRAITLLGDDLATLHVHDDRYGQDRHLIPFQGETDWDGFIKGLREIRYQGVLSLETRIQPKTPQPIRGRLEIELSNIAKYLAEEIVK
jgi:sugar phosphate isomerase/epimerase